MGMLLFLLRSRALRVALVRPTCHAPQQASAVTDTSVTPVLFVLCWLTVVADSRPDWRALSLALRLQLTRS